MNSTCRFTSVVVMTIGIVCAAAPPARAQTPAQMEYERQQREYRQQMERQREEQQRQQQLMNENARRQQEESRRLNAPAAPSATPGYQGGTAQAPSRPQAARAAAPVVTAATDWASTCSSKANGGIDIYVARSTISRSGNRVRMWDMYDFKTLQVADDLRYLSAKNEHEYDCKQPRQRLISTTAYSGNMGKGSVVGADRTSFPWQPVVVGDAVAECDWKIACGKK
jgi:hypothetical protein